MPPIPEPPMSPAQRRRLILQWLARHDRPAPGLQSQMPRRKTPDRGYVNSVPVQRRGQIAAKYDRPVASGVQYPDFNAHPILPVLRPRRQRKNS